MAPLCFISEARDESPPFLISPLHGMVAQISAAHVVQKLPEQLSVITGPSSENTIADLTHICRDEL